MKLPCIAQVVLLVCALSAAWPAAAADADRPARMLWAGSSSLYYHNQPKVCAQWLSDRGNMPAIAELVGRSGTGVHVYLRPDFKAEYGLKPGQSILDKIANGDYDYLVLQIPAEFINGPEGDEHDRSLDVYCKAIRAAGGQPVFYEMGWRRDAAAEVGREKIFRAAVRNQVTLFAPCSTAWQRVRTERPEIELHNPPDTTHPGTLGCYLNQCCFFAALTGKRPEGLPHELLIWWHMDAEEKAALDDRLRKAQFDAYDAALPTWMKRHVLNSRPEKVPAELAAYLQQVAWEEYQAVQDRLKQAIAAENH